MSVALPKKYPHPQFVAALEDINRSGNPFKQAVIHRREVGEFDGTFGSRPVHVPATIAVGVYRILKFLPNKLVEKDKLSSSDTARRFAPTQPSLNWYGFYPNDWLRAALIYYILSDRRLKILCTSLRPFKPSPINTVLVTYPSLDIMPEDYSHLTGPVFGQPNTTGDEGSTSS